MSQTSPPRPTEPFGLWLLSQKKRQDWIGDLARGAAADPLFPKLGMPFDIMDRVRAVMADSDMAQAVDAAANEWFGGYGWRLQGLIEREERREEEREARRQAA